MTTRSTASLAIVLALVTLERPAAQGDVPRLSRQQRAALEALVAAADRATSTPDTTGLDWTTHVLRASDGSHYVAFSIHEPPALAPKGPAVLYVRLASDRGPTPVAERSALAEWLAGQRGGPLPARRGVAFGDMPTFGAGAIAARGPGPQSLQLLEMQRERDRDRRDAEERKRVAALEGTAAAREPNPLLPFEDFDIRMTPITDAAGAPVIRRSLTTGPGRYQLIVGWADASAADIARSVQVVKRTIDLPAGPLAQFGLSSVIIADSVTMRETPYSAAEQTAHPYSIGTMEIVPARDGRLTTDERLALVLQVVSPRAAPDGKPDVAVGFRLSRQTATGQETVGHLAPQIYNQTTLPTDFDVSKGSPLFAAVAIPLTTFKRGTYRVQALADDRIGGVSATESATFEVVGTPQSLLREAPAIAQAFRREAVLTTPAVDALLAPLRVPLPSAPYEAALDAARGSRFVDLIREDAVTDAERGPRTLLRALALYALGSTASTVLPPLKQASSDAAPAASVLLLEGAVRAIEGNDREALARWDAARAAGVSDGVLVPLMMEAHLRLGDTGRAIALGSAPEVAGDVEVRRRMAAALLAAERLAEAIALLDAVLALQPDDLEAQWLLLRALFTGWVRGQGPGADAEGRARLAGLAARYADQGGRHAALARDWAAAVQ